MLRKPRAVEIHSVYINMTWSRIQKRVFSNTFCHPLKTLIVDFIYEFCFKESETFRVVRIKIMLPFLYFELSKV